VAYDQLARAENFAELDGLTVLSKASKPDALTCVSNQLRKESPLAGTESLAATLYFNECKMLRSDSVGVRGDHKIVWVTLRAPIAEGRTTVKSTSNITTTRAPEPYDVIIPRAGLGEDCCCRRRNTTSGPGDSYQWSRYARASLDRLDSWNRGGTSLITMSCCRGVHPGSLIAYAARRRRSFCFCHPLIDDASRSLDKARQVWTVPCNDRMQEIDEHRVRDKVPGGQGASFSGWFHQLAHDGLGNEPLDKHDVLRQDTDDVQHSCPRHPDHVEMHLLIALRDAPTNQFGANHSSTFVRVLVEPLCGPQDLFVTASSPCYFSVVHRQAHDSETVCGSA
jgi:hypothetical protein